MARYIQRDNTVINAARLLLPYDRPRLEALRVKPLNLSSVQPRTIGATRQSTNATTPIKEPPRPRAPTASSNHRKMVFEHDTKGNLRRYVGYSLIPLCLIPLYNRPQGSHSICLWISVCAIMFISLCTLRIPSLITTTVPKSSMPVIKFVNGICMWRCPGFMGGVRVRNGR